MSDWIQLAVLSGVAISCGLVGPFLVLRKMTMFANSLSHTILLGIVLAFLVTKTSLFSPLNLFLGALLAAFMTAFFTGGLVRYFRLREDASVGLVFTTLFSLGISLVTLYTKNIHLGIEAVMGNVDILEVQDVFLSFSLVLLNIGVVFLFYKELKITSFDSNLAKILKIPSSFFQFVILFLASVTAVGAFRSVGVILVLAFLVGPYLTARLFCRRLLALLFWSPLLGIFASFLAVFISRFIFERFDLALSTGGIVVAVIGVIYVAMKFTRWAILLRCERKLQSWGAQAPSEETPSGLPNI